MPKLKYLYYFSSTQIDIIEVKRLDLKDAPISDIYKWLILRKESGKIWELDFKSMHKTEDKEYRTFVEGALTFDHQRATQTLFNDEYTLDVLNPENIPLETSSLIEKYLLNQHEKNDLYSFRELKPSDLHYFIQWIADEEVIRYSMTKFHRLSTNDLIVDWYKSTLSDQKTFQLGILDPKTNHLIGYVGLAGLNEIDRNGEYFIFIGNKEYWRKGIASDATKKILHHGFMHLNLHRIFLTVSSKNSGAIRAYEKAGFRFEGIMREAFYRNHKYSDKVIMGILRDEFES